MNTRWFLTANEDYKIDHYKDENGNDIMQDFTHDGVKCYYEVPPSNASKVNYYDVNKLFKNYVKLKENMDKDVDSGLLERIEPSWLAKIVDVIRTYNRTGLILEGDVAQSAQAIGALVGYEITVNENYRFKKTGTAITSDVLKKYPHNSNNLRPGYIYEFDNKIWSQKLWQELVNVFDALKNYRILDSFVDVVIDNQGHRPQKNILIPIAAYSDKGMKLKAVRCLKNG